jgi:hypothetical protein
MKARNSIQRLEARCALTLCGTPAGLALIRPHLQHACSCSTAAQHYELLRTPERNESFVRGLGEHATDGQREAPQESPEGHRRTPEYNIGGDGNQHITQEKARDHDSAVLFALKVHDAIGKTVRT